MLGFAVIHSDKQEIAVWLVSARGVAASNTNAYVTSTDTAEADFSATIDSLIHSRITLGDEEILNEMGMQRSGFLSLKDVENWDILRQDTQVEMNSFVLSANKNWKIPFEDTELVAVPPAELHSAKSRALEIANYLSLVWSRWLATEGERVRRAEAGNGRVPESLSSTIPRAVPLPGLDQHTWAGAFAGA